MWIQINDREHALILAACALYAETGPSKVPADTAVIATCDGDFPHPSPEEIEAFTDRINENKNLVSDAEMRDAISFLRHLLATSKPLTEALAELDGEPPRYPEYVQLIEWLIKKLTGVEPPKSGLCRYRPISCGPETGMGS